MKTINDLGLDYREKCAISETSKVLKEKFLVEKVMLFGSKARGDDDEESDIDLLVLTSQPVSWNERKAINNALYEIQMKYDTIISTLITTVTEWDEGTFSVLPIHREILDQGVIA
jgi:predicted nucleotidyltransferase